MDELWGMEEGLDGKRTRITIICIRLRLALCDFEIAFVGHLIEGVFAAAEEFAGVAVAKMGHALLGGMFYIYWGGDERKMNGWMDGDDDDYG